MSYTFKWPETKQRAFTIGDDEIEGISLTYQPYCEDGQIIKVDGILVIEWEDGTPNTILDSEEGRHVIGNSMPW